MDRLFNRRGMRETLIHGRKAVKSLRHGWKGVKSSIVARHKFCVSKLSNHCYCN